MAWQMSDDEDVRGKIQQVDEDIDLLETLVLGDNEDLVKQLEERSETKKPKSKVTTRPKRLKKPKRKVAWVDEEDNAVQLKEVVESYKKPKRHKERLDVDVNYNEHLKKKFASLYQTPDWAKLDNKAKVKKNVDDGDEILDGTHAGDLLDHSKSSHLFPGNIMLQRCRDVNFESRAEGSVLKSVEFHPGASIAVIAGLAGIASLFQIDGRNNPKIQSVVFKKFPISSAHFSANGEELIVTSNEFGFFYYYDMLAGKSLKVPPFKGMEQRNLQAFEVSPDGNMLVFYGMYGHIHLVSAKTKEWIGTLKMNGKVRSLAFNRDGSYLYSFGDSGEVYVWNMQTRECIHKFTDEGCIHGTSVSMSLNGDYLSCGSDTGIVNIYDASTILKSSSPKPAKVLYNMTTSVGLAKFNHNSELLLLSSPVKDNAMKLVHFPSMTVFKNFPSDQLNMKKILSFDISVNSGFFAAANNKGTAFLYRLKHYENF